MQQPDLTPANGLDAARGGGQPAGLILLGVLAWELWLAPTGNGMLALKVLPLTLALPGDCCGADSPHHRWVAAGCGSTSSKAWCEQAVTTGLSAQLALLELVLTLALFAACALRDARACTTRKTLA